jgi:hypothetical protein
MRDEPRRKPRYRGERCTSKLTLNRGLDAEINTVQISCTRKGASNGHQTQLQPRPTESRQSLG